jgi:selenocysteine-specific elongation factor
MRLPILSTAGPAGHGKTALVHALAGGGPPPAGETPDATSAPVELGFAVHDIAGRRLGVVDVPGNERLVRGLLSDVHGFDVVLLVVAADQGIRPQTEECVDLLHLLGARSVVVAITRSDLVTGSRLDEIRDACSELLRGTSFASAPIHAVSSVRGDGIAALREEIARGVARVAARDAAAPFRMFVDRSFFVAGRGLTVVGTVLAGSLRSGDAVALRPGKLATQAGAIQVHGETVAQAGPGQRVAVQLAGLERKVVRRGIVLADPRVEFPSDRIDCWLEVRPSARVALRSFDRVEVDLGTVETAGSVIVLDGDAIAPGTSGLAQIALEREVIAGYGDRLVLRPEGGLRTTGGGTVLHPFAVRHHQREPELLARLTRLREPALATRLLAFLALVPEVAAPLGYLAQGLDRLPEEIQRTAAGIPDLVALPAAAGTQAFTTRARWDDLVAAVSEVLARYHRAHEREPGMDAEALRARLRVPVPPRLLDAVLARLVADGTVARSDDLIRLPSHRAAASPATRETAHPELAPERGDPTGAVRDVLAAAGFAPPDVRGLEAQLAIRASRLRPILAALERDGAVVAVAADLYFDRMALERARSLLRAHLAEHAEITVADYRTLLASSRKYALALLEHFDRTNVTVRTGDARRLRDAS